MFLAVFVNFIIRFLYLFFRFLYPHDQVFVRANWNLSGLCTEKTKSVIRVMYGQRSFYQVHVLINAVLSGFCTENHSIIRIMYGKAESIIRIMCGQDGLCTMAPGCGTIHCATIYCGTIVVDRLLCHDLLWNDSFRPFSERHFYCV